MTYHPRFILDACPVAGCDRTHGVLAVRPVKVSPLRPTADDFAGFGEPSSEDASAVARSGDDDRSNGSGMDLPLDVPAAPDGVRSPVSVRAGTAGDPGSAIER